MQASDRLSLPAGKLSQNPRVRRGAPHIENISLLQPFIRRDAMIWISRKNHRSARTNHFLNQKQNAIKRKAEIQSVHSAVDVDQIAGRQIKIIDQDAFEIRFSQGWQRSQTTALAFPLRVTKRIKRARGEN